MYSKHRWKIAQYLVWHVVSLGICPGNFTSFPVLNRGVRAFSDPIAGSPPPSKDLSLPKSVGMTLPSPLKPRVNLLVDQMYNCRVSDPFESSGQLMIIIEPHFQ